MPSIKQSTETLEFNERGEMISKRANKTLSWGAEPPYIKLYLQDILYLSDIPNKHENVLYQLLKRTTYAGEKNGMEVVVNSALKRRIAKELDFKNIGSISNAITDLVKGKVLIRKDVGIYQFNSYFFGKGDWQDIARLRLEINYDEIKGRTFKTVCDYEDKKKIESKAEEMLYPTGTEG